MADDGFAYEVVPDSGYPVYFPTVQTVDGDTVTSGADGRSVVLVEAVNDPALLPANDAAQAAADVFAEAFGDGPLADRVTSMHVDEVVPLLDALGPDDLAAVHEAEAAGKGRKTILARIGELLPADDAAVVADGEEV
jgi:hypothetical protein